MSSIFYFFSLGKKQSFTQWVKLVCKFTDANVVQNGVESEVFYLDSFDSSIYRSKKQLILEKSSELIPHKYLLRCVDNSNIHSGLAAVPLDKIPKFVDDLPEGSVRKQIKKILGVRALTPIASIRVKQTVLKISDKQSKTRVRIFIEHNRANQNNSVRFSDLGCRLRVESLTGYKKDSIKVINALKNKLNLSQDKQDELYTLAVKASGHTPGEYSSKVNVSLKREWRVDKACREVLRSQLDQMEQNIEGTINNIDTEFLHDLRVAVRRSRSLISRMKGAFPKTVTTRFSRDLAWIGSITTPLRDLDVYMLDFPEYKKSLNPDFRKDLDPFYDFLNKRHEKEQMILIKHLKSKRFETFRVRLRSYLDSPLPKTSQAELALMPIGEVADKRIWKTYRRLINEGSSITDKSPNEAVHELRKTCKKLRYLLEFFSSLYRKKQVKEIMKSLKFFQENLGDFQDLSVQAMKINRFKKIMIEEGLEQTRTAEAMELLIMDLKLRKKKIRKEFAERFAGFASKEIETKFKIICGKSPAKTARRKSKNKFRTAKKNKTKEIA